MCLRLRDPLALDEGVSEHEVYNELRALAGVTLAEAFG